MGDNAGMAARLLRWFFPRPPRPSDPWVIFAIGMGLLGLGLALGVMGDDWGAYVIAGLGGIQAVTALALRKIHKAGD
jgi:hypothetical protein